MGCVFGREISSSSGTVSESKRRDISVESTTRKVDEDSVEKVENNNAAEILDGGTQAQKEKKGDGEQTQRPPKGERRRSKPNQRLSNVPKHSRGEQAAAGWPAWLTDTCGEALSGWIPRRADTFEKIDKVIFLLFASLCWKCMFYWFLLNGVATMLMVVELISSVKMVCYIGFVERHAKKVCDCEIDSGMMVYSYELKRKREKVYVI